MGNLVKRLTTGGYVFVLSLFFMCASACHTAAREPVYTNDLRVMDSTEIAIYNLALTYFFDSLLNANNFSGGILVAKNGKVLYEHYQGNIYGKDDALIDENTPFHVASTSKTFTSTAILQLEAAGKLKLDDSLRLYWPDFPYASVTIRHLLNHSSGIPNYANFLSRYKWDRKITASNYDVLDVLTRNKPLLEFSTGLRFKYCNTNFLLLALIVEKVTGITFPFYVNENIFKVAGMNHSYVLTHLNSGDYMPSWTASGRIYNFDYLDGIYGDKNVFTTCRDLMLYDSAIRTGMLLDSTKYSKAWEPYFKDGNHNEPWEYYGLGWRLKIFNDTLIIPYHNGWWHGNNAVFQRLVSDTAVIIVTGNRMNNKIYKAALAANIFRQYYPDSLRLPAEDYPENILEGNELPLDKEEHASHLPVNNIDGKLNDVKRSKNPAVY